MISLSHQKRRSCGNVLNAEIIGRHRYEKGLTKSLDVLFAQEGEAKLQSLSSFPTLFWITIYPKTQKTSMNTQKELTPKVHWKCHDCGNEWFASFNQRASKGYGCKICTTNREMERRNQMKISQKGSFAHNHPDMAKEWGFRS